MAENANTESKINIVHPPQQILGLVPRKIRVIGVPLDLGQTRRGVDMGPSAVRVAGLGKRGWKKLGHQVEDAGNVGVAIAEPKKEGAVNARYLKEITQTCTKEAELVEKTLEAGEVPLGWAATTQSRWEHVRRFGILPQPGPASA